MQPSTMLACLVVAVSASTAAQARRGALKYACEGGQCVPNSRGLPLAECQAVCAPSPSANYSCTAGQCVVSGRGLPKAQCTQVCGGPGPAPAPGGKTIVDLAVATPDLSTLVTALKAGGLVDTLSGPGPFTVFAPTNEAFTALPAGVLANLLKRENKAQLDNVLTYHVVAGAVRAEALKDGEKIKTLQGEELTVRIAGGDVFINSANVTTADVTASNGVVHIIDGVLLPSGPPAPTPAPPRPANATGCPKGRETGGGCTKEACCFSFTWPEDSRGTPFGYRCGEVDAAPRMPDDIWDDRRAVSLYVQDTLALYSNGFFQPFDPQDPHIAMTLKPCYHEYVAPRPGWVKGPYKGMNGTQQIRWADSFNGGHADGGFKQFCEKRCKCCLDNGVDPVSSSCRGLRLPTCTDKPDTPPKYCSLCGPTLNAPIDVQFWYPTDP